jgi:hypothetical protein
LLAFFVQALHYSKKADCHIGSCTALPSRLKIFASHTPELRSCNVMSCHPHLTLTVARILTSNLLNLFNLPAPALHLHHLRPQNLHTVTSKRNRSPLSVTSSPRNSFLRLFYPSSQKPTTKPTTSYFPPSKEKQSLTTTSTFLLQKPLNPPTQTLDT